MYFFNIIFYINLVKLKNNLAYNRIRMTPFYSVSVLFYPILRVRSTDRIRVAKPDTFGVYASGIQSCFFSN